MTREHLYITGAVFIAGVALYVSLATNIHKDEHSDNESSSLLSAKMDGLNKQLLDAEFEISQLRNQQYAVSARVLDLEFKSPEAADFRTTDTSFHVISGPYTNLLVSLKNVEKFGDGYKLMFDFGNPSGVAIVNMQGKIKWHPTIDLSEYGADAKYRQQIDLNTHDKTILHLDQIDARRLEFSTNYDWARHGGKYWRYRD